jgi:Leucine-rich repeat (LRR) protein
MPEISASIAPQDNLNQYKKLCKDACQSLSIGFALVVAPVRNLYADSNNLTRLLADTEVLEDGSGFAED